jgi:hypothetical protein
VNGSSGSWKGSKPNWPGRIVASLGEIMKGLALYEDETDQRQHFSAIQTLVKDMIYSEEEIRHLYEGVLKEFKNEARIKTFLSILVSKKVKELLNVEKR